ncbi:MAG: seg [Candidatus Taylorbacteria bacterium]|nr:seg [Candidatus Taylorbacteria bacterium]
MNRKVILALTLAIILAIASMLYFYFSKTPTSNNTTGGFFKSLLPFGSNNTSSNNASDTPLIIGGGSNSDGTNTLKSLPRLRHYTTEPTAGDIITEKDKDVIQDRVKTTIKETSLRYMDRATGHMYDIATNAETAKKISNTTIPKVYEATFTPGGDSLVARFLDANENILTYFITLKDKKASVATTSVKIATSTADTVAAKQASAALQFKDVTGTYLTQNIRELALGASGKKILQLVYGSNGGIISTLDTNVLKPKTVLASPLREWLLSYPTDTKAIITTKPSGTTYGYSYILNIATGSMTKLVGNILGMTVLPNTDLSSYLVGYASETLKLSVLNSKDSSLSGLSINTLPEKCVWSNVSTSIVYCAVPKSIPRAVYPDDWYKGKMSFNDSLWKINVKTGETNLISNLSIESSQIIDATNLQISSTDKYLTFINKRDLTLWGIDLTIKQ